MSKFSTIAFNHKLPEQAILFRLQEPFKPTGTMAAVGTAF